MVAGTVQTAIITPVDLLKIRMQLQTAPQGTPEYVGSLRMLGRVLQREGFLGEQASTVAWWLTVFACPQANHCGSDPCKHSNPCLPGLCGHI